MSEQKMTITKDENGNLWSDGKQITCQSKYGIKISDWSWCTINTHTPKYFVQFEYNSKLGVTLYVKPGKLNYWYRKIAKIYYEYKGKI